MLEVGLKSIVKKKKIEENDGHQIKLQFRKMCICMKYLL